MFSKKKFLLFKKYYFLTNYHVIAPSHKETVGSYIIQPSKSYGGSVPKDTIGYLKTFSKISLFHDLKDIDKATPNDMDCALCKITESSLISKNEIIGGGKINGVAKATLELSVKKIGALSGLTEGKITTIGETRIVDFGDNNYALFKDVILSDFKNEDGDSGSAVLNENNEIVGLFFAGTNLVSCITDIETILKKFKVELYTG